MFRRAGEDFLCFALQQLKAGETKCIDMAVDIIQIASRITSIQNICNVIGCDEQIVQGVVKNDQQAIYDLSVVMM